MLRAAFLARVSCNRATTSAPPLMPRAQSRSTKTAATVPEVHPSARLVTAIPATGLQLIRTAAVPNMVQLKKKGGVTGNGPLSHILSSVLEDNMMSNEGKNNKPAIRTQVIRRPVQSVHKPLQGVAMTELSSIFFMSYTLCLLDRVGTFRFLW